MVSMSLNSSDMVMGWTSLRNRLRALNVEMNRFDDHSYSIEVCLACNRSDTNGRKLGSKGFA